VVVNVVSTDVHAAAGLSGGSADGQPDLTLAGLVDGLTSRRAWDLLDLPSARCWEVDPGDLSFATWLADQVGPDGEVLATSAKPRLIAAHPRLVVLRHRLTVEDPPGRFDLVHVRWLATVPQRRLGLAKLIAALKPGGVLLVEEFAPPPTEDFVAAAPSAADAALLRQFHGAYLRMLSNRRVDLEWAKRVHGVLAGAGLDQVGTDVTARSWPGGGFGTQLLRQAVTRSRTELMAAGMTAVQVHKVRTLLDDPRVVLHGQSLYSTSGRRPREDEAT